MAVDVLLKGFPMIPLSCIPNLFKILYCKIFAAISVSCAAHPPSPPLSLQMNTPSSASMAINARKFSRRSIFKKSPQKLLYLYSYLVHAFNVQRL
jgi:hypothetical protein